VGYDEEGSSWVTPCDGDVTLCVRRVLPQSHQMSVNRWLESHKLVVQHLDGQVTHNGN